MTKIYKINVNPFYIKAYNTENAINILWEKFGVPFIQIEDISIDKNGEYADNE